MTRPSGARPGPRMALIVATVALAGCGGSAASEPAAPGTRPEVMALTGVNVVPMDRDTVLMGQTVLVRSGVIAAVGPTDDLQVPAEALVVDGRGRYVMPGLIDGHVHAWYDDDLRLYVANGITGMRNLWGDQLHLDWRDRIATDPLFVAPTLWTAGKLLDGEPPIWPTSGVVTTREEGRAVVRDQVEAGYDFIKVYARLSEEAFQGIAEEANRLGVPFEGHVPGAVGLYPALDAGMRGIEHFRGYYGAIFTDPETGDEGLTEDERLRMGRGFLDGTLSPEEAFDEERVARAVSRTVEAGAWNTPTVTVVQSLPHDEYPARRASREAQYLPDERLDGWDPAGGRWAEVSSEDIRAIRAFSTEFSLYLIRRLHEADGNLVVGTDTPNPWVIPGFALHDEIDFFLQAGLTPWETLSRTTRITAQYMGMEDRIGQVKPGFQADLVMTDGNPLEDPSTLRNPQGVMLRGLWMDRTALDEMLEGVRERAGR